MTRIICPDLAPAVRMFPEQYDGGWPVLCVFADCRHCTPIRRDRLRGMPEPTVTEDDRDPPDLDDAPYDDCDRDPDLMRSER